MKLLKLFFLSLLSMMLVACGGGKDGGLPSQGGRYGGDVTKPVVVLLQLTPKNTTIAVGFKQQYAAQITFDDGSIVDVTKDPALHWYIDEPSVASIDNTGLDTGLTLGKTVITVSYLKENGIQLSATAELVVTAMQS